MKRTCMVGLLFLALMTSAALANQPVAEDYVSAIGEYYGIPTSQAKDIAQQVSAEELPIICFVAERSKLQISDVVKLHHNSDSWAHVASECGLTSADFFVWGVSGMPSKTFSPILEKYKSKAAGAWSEVSLTDSEIVDLVNLRFIQGYFGSPAESVMAARDETSNWTQVYTQVKTAAGSQNKTPVAKAD